MIPALRDWWAKRRVDFWRWVVGYHTKAAAGHKDLADWARLRASAALCDWAVPKK